MLAVREKVKSLTLAAMLGAVAVVLVGATGAGVGSGAALATPVPSTVDQL